MLRKAGSPNRCSHMPKRGLGAQVAVFIVIAVCVVAAIGVVSLMQSGATSGSTTSSNDATKATFLYRTMPKEFAVGGYMFYMEYNGTYLVTTFNGTATANTGFNLELRVSNGLSNQTIVFGWAPPAPSPGVLPTPDSATLFGGGLQLNWFSNSTGTYLRASLSQATSTVTAPGSTTTSFTLSTGPSDTITTVTGYPTSSSPSAGSSSQQGGTQTVTATVTTKVGSPGGTTTVTECSSTNTSTVTTTLIESSTTQAVATVTTTATLTSTSYGSTATATGCQATVTTETVTQTTSGLGS